MNESGEKCTFHETIAVHLANLDNRSTGLEVRMEKVEAKVYSPTVVVAVLALIGTVVTVAGSILSIVVTAFLKAHGYMG